MSNNENDIGGKVGLDITEFKTNTAELNRQIKVIDTGFKAAAAGMEDWGKSEEGLENRIEALNKITDLQRQKVNNLTREYEKVAAEKGENSRAAQDLQIKINKETEALNKNEKELKNSVAALDKLGDESLQAAKDTDKLDSSLEDAKKTLKDFGGNVAKVAIAGIAAIGTAALGAAAGAFKLAVDAGKMADDLLTLSNQTGISTKQLQEWEYAMRFIDVDMDVMTKSMAKLIKGMDNASKGGKDVTDAFSRLGVSFVDNEGKMRNHQEVFMELIDALGKVENETERDALAMRLFGKSAQELNPLIKAGSQELAKLSEEASKYGAVISDEVLAAAGEFDDAMQRIDAAKKGLITNLGAAFAPVFTDFADLLMEQMPKINEMLQGIDKEGMVKGLADSLEKAINNLKWLSDNSGNIAAGAAAIGAGIITWNAVTTVQAMVELVRAWKVANEGLTIAQAALNLVMAANPIGLIITLIAALVAGFIVLWNTNEDFRNALIGAWDAIMGAGEAVWGWLVKVFTEVIPGAAGKVIDFFKNNWKDVLLFLTNPIAGALKFFYNLNPKFQEWVNGVYNTVTDKLKAIGKVDWAAVGRSIIDGIINGVKNAASSLAKTAANAAKSALTAAKSALGINSPSRVFEQEVGMQIGAGMARGISKSTRQVNQAMSGLNNQLNIDIPWPWPGSAPHGGGGAGAAVVVNVPLSLDGQIITTATSRIQLGHNRSRSRALGVVPA